MNVALMLAACVAPAMAQLQPIASPHNNKLEISAFSASDALELSPLKGEQRYSSEQVKWWERAIPTTQTALVGNYIHDSYNNSMSPTSVTGMYMMNIAAAGGTNAVTLNNILGAGGSIQGIVNPAEGTITIAGGQAIGTLENNEAKIYLADFNLNRYYNDAIVARVSPRGIVIMPQMLVVLADGRQLRCYGDMLYKMNATQTDYSVWKEGEEAVKSYPVHFSRTNSSQILLKNFYGYGFPVNGTIDTVGNVLIPYAQVSVGVSSTGSQIVLRNYNVTAINYNTTPPTPTCNTSATPAKFEADSIVTGSYCVAGSTTANRLDLILKSVIKVQLSDAFTPMETGFSFQGEGTKDNPYKIATAADLLMLSRATNYNVALRTAKQVFAGKYFVQTADIDLGNVENFEPIVWDHSHAFAATYDGQGHTIANMTISGTRGADYHSAFIGELDAAGEVKNLKFANPKITSTSSYVATVAGHAYGLIENIQVTDADISMPANSSSYCGGIAGLMVNNCRIHDCSITGSIAGQSFVGGIGGNCNGSKIRRCTVNAELKTVAGTTANAKIGGVLGYCTRDTALVEDCLFVGTITLNADEHAGGILGGGQKSLVNRCMSSAQIMHRATSQQAAAIGGIIGRAEGTKMTDCLFTGITQSYATSTVGGLLGATSGGATLVGSLNLGTMMCAGNVRGNELEGIDAGATITNCYYDNQAGFNYGTIGGLTTEQLTSGQLPEGLSGEIWIASVGKYPILKQFASIPRAALDITPFFLKNGENVMGIRSDFTVGQEEGVNWYLFHNMLYSTQGNGLKIDGNNVKVTATSLCSDTIVAIKGNYFKMIPVKITPKEFDGEGTEQSPYIIRNLSDLNRMFKAVDVDLFDYSDTYFRIDADIDYAGVTNFTPYSHTAPAYAFNGVLDGGGHSIKNLVLPEADNSSAIGAFITYTGPKSVIKNITIDSTCRFNGGSNVAFVAAAYGRLEGIINLAPVTALFNNAAGIASLLYEGGEVINCYNGATITGGHRYAGGIVAQASRGSLISGCQNSANVSAVTTAFNKDASDLMYIGGIVGDGEGSIIDCLNQGMITGCTETGGIAGSYTGSDTNPMRRCLNTGLVKEGEKNTTRGAIMGSAWSIGDGRVTGNSYDKQFAYNAAAAGGDLDGVTPLTTQKLTSGQPVDSLSADLWQYAAGKYPVLKAFANQEASKWYSEARVEFASSPRLESRFDKRSDAVIILPQGSVDTLAVGEKFSIADGKLHHTQSQEAIADTITLRSSDGSYIISAPVFATPKLLANGSGTISDPWIINTSDEWNIVADYSNTYQKDFDEEYFRLGADLDFSKGFEPICIGSAVYFNGIIDGNGKSVRNAKYADENQKYVGLIGSAGGRAKVYNLTIDSTCNFSGNQYVGAVAGHFEGEIHNVINYATVTTTKMQYAAGVAGEITGNAFVHHCTNYGIISSDANSGAAGIVANAGGDDVRVEDCVNYGSISAKGTCGGVVSTSKGCVTRCDNYGNVTSTSTNAGGIAGYLWAVEDPLVSDCNNYAPVSATGNAAGGIVGYMQGSGHIARCVNHEKVTSTGNYAGGILGTANTASSSWTIRNVENRADVSANAYAGGIIGYSNTSVKDKAAVVDTASNYGNVKALKTTYAGGIAGNVSNYVELRNVYNYGDTVFTTTYSAGGIAGRSTGSIINAYNHADVISTTYNAGGICGESNTSTVTDYGCTIKNVINVGSVKSLGTTDANGFKVGGILGTGWTIVENAVNLGDVEGRKSVGGIVGLPIKGKSETVFGTQVLNSYVAARVSCTYATNAKTCGIIMGDNTTAVTFTNIANTFYDNQMSGASIADTYADAKHEKVVGLPTKELFKASLGAGFTVADNAYPMPATLANHDFATVASAALLLQGTDNADRITGSFKITSPQGVKWSAPDMSFSHNGSAIWTRADLANKTAITASLGNHYRRVMLQITTATGAELLDGEAEITNVEYYNLSGLRIAQPQPGEISIRVTNYNNGTTRKERIIITEK